MISSLPTNRISASFAHISNFDLNSRFQIDMDYSKQLFCCEKNNVI